MANGRTEQVDDCFAAVAVVDVRAPDMRSWLMAVAEAESHQQPERPLSGALRTAAEPPQPRAALNVPFRASRPAQIGQDPSLNEVGLPTAQAQSYRRREVPMTSKVLGAVLGTAMMAITALASASDRAVFRDGEIEVVVLTTELPAEFKGHEADPDWQWFGVGKLVSRISVTVGKIHAVLPARAYLGMTDPKAVKIARSDRNGAWTLTVTGGDASTAYRTVMEFVGQDVRLVKEYALEADDAHPYVTEVFAPAPGLN